MTAVAGTVIIAAGAFWLSFTALADLARRSGIEAGQAWAWPLIVDGIIVVSTVAVVALAGTRAAWYPWMLLICGAGLSVTANSIHAIVAKGTDVPAVLAASVAAVPPLVLLAITHLTVILTGNPPEGVLHPRAEAAELDATPVLVASPAPVANLPVLDVPPHPGATAVPAPAPSLLPRRGGREMAKALRANGWSNKKIARHLDVHPSTVGRWLPQPIRHPTTEPDTEPSAETEAEPVIPAADDSTDEEEPS
ncbi:MULTISPECIES: DUF2637 domain-containing protein [unclassified Microbacterium]|uniref:DUF2637 domain-containing protein n=1 Tax=unclassified Microbacterium TaxID=2609290 RepID=UPI003018B37F